MIEHPARRITGNTDAIDGEIRRLHDVKENLWSNGHRLRNLTIDGWTGVARDLFDDFRHRFAHRWLTTGDLHEDAARALERYYETLLELKGRVATAGPDGANPADLIRWRQQLDSEARAAAATIRRAAQTLADLPRLLDEPLAAPVIAAPPPRAAQNHPTGADPRTASLNPSQFRQHVQALSDQILHANIITIPPT